MTRKNKGHNTRSKNLSSPPQKEHSLIDSCAAAIQRTPRRTSSLHRVETVPTGRQQQQQHIATEPRVSHTDNFPTSSKGSNASEHSLGFSDNGSTEKLHVCDLQNEPAGALANAGEREGDNRGTLSVPVNSSVNEPEKDGEQIYSNQSKETVPPAPHNEPWKDAFGELRALRSEMAKIDRIDKTTMSLSDQMSAMFNKTSALETKTVSNASKIKSLNEEVSNLKAVVAEQKAKIEENSSLKALIEKQNEKIEETSSLKAMVEKQNEKIAGLAKIQEQLQASTKVTMGEITETYSKKTKRTIGEMNDLMVQQKEQVESFNSATKRIKTDILHEVDKKVDQKVGSLAQDLSHKELTKQAFSNRHNLIITGLPEDSTKSVFELTKDFLGNTLGIKDVDIGSPYRIGSPPGTDSSYARPIFIKFQHISHRNKVWRKRQEITAEDGVNVTRIQADIPKKLREDLRTMYRIVKAASTIPKYQSAAVREYALFLDGQEYLPNQLESLPYQLRPSTLASRSSDKAIVFFSKHCFMSNHFPADFCVQGLKFHNVEQFLAYKRSTLSGQQQLIQKALHTVNPVEAKAILNILKEDHVQEWSESRAQWALEGLRAKFNQNAKLAEKLCKTKNLKLGEASRNQTWAIGMDLDNPHVLDVSKWLPKGNLLGRSLMEIRAELLKTGKEKTK